MPEAASLAQHGRCGIADAPYGHLGGFGLLEILGAGSIGIVYRTIDPRTQQPRALKVLRPELLAAAPRQELLTHFAREAAIGRRLRHPGILAVYTLGVEGGNPYLVMEAVEGTSLAVLLERRIAFGRTGAVRMLAALLEALDFAHRGGVYHCDLKPANVLVTRDGEVKIADFGLAHLSWGQQPVSETLGTPGYIAPETYRDSPPDARVDVFAAGAILYQLLTGAAPYAGNAAQILFQIYGRAPAPPSQVCRNPQLLPLDGVVLRALALDPADRFATAAQFRSALLTCAAAPGPISARS
jgi:serine/threonine protein kinase